MKKVSQRFWIILMVLACFALLQACATAPKLPEPKPGLYVNRSPSCCKPDSIQASSHDRRSQ
jgi:uncharacterized protein YceK